jgi:hypothetical protein
MYGVGGDESNVRVVGVSVGGGGVGADGCRSLMVVVNEVRKSSS